MKKQIIQLSVVVCVLVVCILGYFIIKGQFDKKNEEKENQGKTTVFTLDDYKNTKKFSYKYDGNTLTLENNNGTWKLKENTKLKIDKSVIESEMLKELVEIQTSDVISGVEDLSDYGFSKKEGKISPTTNTIKVTDSNEKSNVIYIGSVNPYDSTLYYIMIKGDDNIYTVSSDFVEAFNKGRSDLKKEEETTTESLTTTESVATKSTTAKERVTTESTTTK